MALGLVARSMSLARSIRHTGLVAICHTGAIALSIRVAEVGIDARSAGAEAVYTYRATEETRLGDAHFVPLGARRVMGFVVGLRTIHPDELGFPVSLLKDLGEHVDGVGLPQETVALAQEVANQTLTPLAMAVTLVAPPGIRDRVVVKWSATGAKHEEAMTPAQREALRVLSEGPLIDSKTKPLSRGSKSALHALERRGLASRSLEVAAFTGRSKAQGLLRLSQDSRLVERFLLGAGSKRPAQTMAVLALQGSESATLSQQEIKALVGVSDSTIKALLDQGLLELVEGDSQPLSTPPEPNPQQAKAITQISQAIEKREPTPFLLYGVTGSGKTEVYLRAAAEALKRGRQVLYLVPEIALTAQVIALLRARFGGSVVVMHSNMSAQERLDSWMSVRKGDSPVVLGARSALFAPFSNLGLIVMDEEHESSYKQENAPRYHTRRLATFLSKEFGAPLVMGSATPSIETFFDAAEGRVVRLDLPQRAASAQMPEVFVEDMTDLYKGGKPSLFSDRLHEGIGLTLAAGHQAILFLNRRAYSPFIICRDCGHRFLCPDCTVSLALHSRDKRLRCHHCGHQERVPDKCPACSGTRVSGFGVGAERVEEAVKEEFPNARVARLDRDTTKVKGALEEIFAKFRAHETDVLVGTQMVAKGLDFPNVTLVGVIAADVSLNIPDFRASERTFQLLSQVAGRSGRGTAPGEVVIQTFTPDHIAVQCAQRHDYGAFFEAICLERRLAEYPPFVRLVNVLVIGDDRDDVVTRSQTVADRLRTGLPDMTVLGPTSCPIERRSKLWRRHVLVKLPPNSPVGLVSTALEGLDTKRTRVWIDVDAYNLS